MQQSCALLHVLKSSLSGRQRFYYRKNDFNSAWKRLRFAALYCVERSIP